MFTDYIPDRPFVENPNARTNHYEADSSLSDGNTVYKMSRQWLQVELANISTGPRGFLDWRFMGAVSHSRI